MSGLPSPAPCPSPSPGREVAAAKDADAPLPSLRHRFVLPEGVVYLDGNSLGALPHGVAERLRAAVTEEWASGLIGSWNDAGWMDLPRRAALRIGRLIGADPAAVHVGDSTSVLLFKTMVAAARLRPDRRVLVLEPTTFPTDGYVAAGVADLLDLELRWCDPADPAASLDDDVALLSLTHVDFRTGAMFDMSALTRAAHDIGALVQWDLSHTTGAMPVDLAGIDADFAVGCTYKYLNGGPGAPAYAYVAPRLHDLIRQPVNGWMGHVRPFEMGLSFEPAPDASRLGSGTPPVLALSALDTALEVFDDVDLDALRAQSLSLTDWFIELVDARLGGRVEVITPRVPDTRGSQVSLRHASAYGIVQALIARGVVGDFRTPDFARFGFAPLYVTHVDVYDAVAALLEVLDGEEYARPEYALRNAVT
ncbi:MAG: kynureninase [Nocardioidaceae bacterium]|nr:kynureninase [Nocardioidaceae bacterium]